VLRHERWVSDSVYAELERLLREPETPAAPTPPLRKSVTELVPADLERYPIWELALDEEGEEGQDETTARPRPDLDRAAPSHGYFIVRIELLSADGTRFDGYATPWPDGEPSSVQPTIVTDRGQVRLWLGAFGPRPGGLEHAYALLGKTADQLFPLAYRALVAVDGPRVEGVVPAFLRRRSVSDATIVELR
jgi:hypothetical protein